jgi:hypothetical protein
MYFAKIFKTSVSIIAYSKPKTISTDNPLVFKLDHALLTNNKSAPINNAKREMALMWNFQVMKGLCSIWMKI